MKSYQVNVEVAKNLGLLEEEYYRIIDILGREPNFTELSLYAVMWSEHCSYKNSIKWLKTLPRKGGRLLVEAGSENAGLIDIGDGLACCFKIESHNHPSAIEPYQGAATGVGGINRDIFTMGARPIAQLNSLRFGNPELEKTRWLCKGVVKGIGDYGNSFGVPVLAGEVYFEECYNNNPLVNAMSVGIVKKDEICSAVSKGKGNPVYIVGSLTGKDGIHGATFASEDISENSDEKLPAVQVGDPFQEKILLEATLEIIKTGAVVGMQDMGAAGIICSTSEMSARGKHGMIIHLDKVPLRQKNMEPYEILLSESQERMLVVVEKGREKDVEKIFDKWDLNYSIIGEVTESEFLEFYMNGNLVAKVPAESLVLGGGAPVYDREYKEPDYYKKTKQFDINQIPEPENLKEVAIMLTSHPNIASKKWVTEQYDTMVRTNNMTTNAPADAGIINIKESKIALAVTVDCNARYVYADPDIGTQIAVAEAARNIVCSGATPVGITNCLNFGNPYNPEVYWQFVKAIQGMTKACLKFNTPVTGGNVSFYNQTVIDDNVIPVFPTPTIGMVGIIEDKTKTMSLHFKKKGHVIFLLGKVVEDINSSQYLVSYHGVKLSPPPYFDLDEEYKVHQILLELIKNNLIASAHDVSDGGLFITLLESAMPENLGFDILTDAEIRMDAFLFGEAQGRIVVSVSQEKEEEFLDFMLEKSIKPLMLGHVTKGEIRINDQSWGFIKDYKNIYETALEKIMEK